MRKHFLNILFLLLFSSVAQSMIINDSTKQIETPIINPLAQSWISWTERGVQVASATAGVVVSAGTETLLAVLGTAALGLVPAAVLGAATYYWILKKCHPKTATGLCLRIQRSLNDFEKQFAGDELVAWKSDDDVKAFAELNFYGSMKDVKEHLRQRMKKLAVIRTYLQAGQSKVQDSVLKQLYDVCAERLGKLEHDTMMKFRRVCEYSSVRNAQTVNQ